MPASRVPTPQRITRRVALAATAAAVLVVALAGPASAHISVEPPSAPRGGTAKLSFIVPNEETNATVTEIQIFFPVPPDTPIPSVHVGRTPGWKATITTKHLAKPIVTDDGSISEVVSEIDWKATSASARIGRDEFGEFSVDADGLPSSGTQVVFKALQTYSNGDLVRWIDPVTPNGPPADHPTPILQLTAPTAGTATPTTSATTPATTVGTAKDNSARALGIVAIVLGAVALLFGTGALMRKRRA